MSWPNPRSLLALVAAAAMLGLAVAVWFHQRSGETAQEIDLNSPPLLPAQPARAAVRFAVAPVLSPERTFDVYLTLADYLATELDRPVRMIQRKTYHEVNELLRHGQVDAAIICTGAYLAATMEKTPLEVIAVPEYPEGPVYYSFVLVAADSPVQSLEQLRGRPFAFSDPLSLSGHYYPLYALLSRGEDPGTYFSETTFTYSHDGSMRAVLDGIVDGAGVDSLVYQFEVRRNPELAQRLRIIHRSPPLGGNPIVVPKSLDPELRAALQHALLRAAENPAGRRALGELDIERFVLPQPGLYQSVAQLYAEVRSHLEKQR